MKEAYKNLILLATTLLILFVLLEVTCAVFGLSELNRPVSYRTQHDVFHHALTPSSEGTFTTAEWDVTYTINSQGYRDREWQLEKNSATRIAVLGDSFTEGYGVEYPEAFTNKLQPLLAQRGYDVEVLNFGVASYSPILELLVLEHNASRYEPDIIILNYDWSDPQGDYLYNQTAQYENNTLIKVSPPSAAPKTMISRILYFLSRHSHVYQFFAIRLSALTSPITPYDLETDRLIFTRDNLTMEQRDRLFSYSVPHLLEIQEYAQRINATLIIHTYPYAHQVGANGWSGRNSFFFEAKQYPTTPFDQVEEFTREHDITYISSLDAFLAAEDTTPLYFHYDGHFSPRGHELVAEELARQLAESGILNQSRSA